ncbi:transporter substrate-binding domain-containing protein [Legionella longbeachae]|uniref:Putative arginine-binding periplasmic protein n=1 Tax=Legionella longbeachae serogroup 1 (strain NSW150) TaxID=661367 RepID=D3HMU1_LEGLN|nr:transporter substrate-binding domain-containing protein [Legionella longbeachae]VEE04293.1 arginine-binding periplasmic protein [Legionella oakridgensis]HBD7397063.1 transporter substrate-binding domain-containing protein [Legionella pneumophila]ARB92881.1 ABC transporter substrate-binding protein [Legionella longbeachae]EEZ96814.1 bacterial extracellular solute-binding family 3 protein [Legionella longbeachae D-4968]QIN33879.1 transporter substrate-binding domain-containing protein [Legion
MKMLKQIIFLALLSSNMFAYSATITVGVGKFVPPFSAADTSNHYFGFCIDLINELCKRMNDTCEYKSVMSEGIEASLTKGIVDVTLTPTPISPDVSSEYIFSMPYMTSSGQFITNNPDIKSLKDLQGKRIGIIEESNLKTTLLSYTPIENVKEFSKLPDLIEALNNNDIDAILLNVNILKNLINNQIINFRLVGKPVNLGNGYGLLALKRNAALIDKFNKALLQIENDGTYEGIYNKYFGK